MSEASKVTTLQTDTSVRNTEAKEQVDSMKDILNTGLLAASIGEELEYLVGDLKLSAKVGTPDSPECPGTASSIDWPSDVKSQLSSQTSSGQNVNCMTTESVIDVLFGL